MDIIVSFWGGGGSAFEQKFPRELPCLTWRKTYGISTTASDTLRFGVETPSKEGGKLWGAAKAVEANNSNAPRVVKFWNIII